MPVKDVAKTTPLRFKTVEEHQRFKKLMAGAYGGPYCEDMRAFIEALLKNGLRDKPRCKPGECALIDMWTENEVYDYCPNCGEIRVQEDE